MNTANDDRLNEILVAYLEAHEAGVAPNRKQWLDAYPEFRNELGDFLDSRRAVERYASPIREAQEGADRFDPELTSDLLTGSILSKPSESRLGQLGDFRLIREVGRGGMGVVYEAEQQSLKRRVALKVLPFAAAMDERQLQRFRNEAMAAGNLRHEHIVPVFAVGAERGVHYYAMQFIEGQSLAALIESLRGAADPSEATVQDAPAKTRANRESSGRNSPSPKGITPRRVAQLGREAALALEHAHQMGVVHRDIKPANLLLDPAGALWITDFGLAQVQSDVSLTRTGEMLGTLRYASPEQLLGRSGLIDHRCDIYSLGATLYEFVTLRPMFAGRDRNELLQQVANAEPIPPRAIDDKIPWELETILLKAIAKQPDDRYRSAKELADDLERFEQDRPIQARRPTWVEQGYRWGRRHRSFVLFGTVGLFVALGLLALGLFVTLRAYDQARVKAWEADDERRRAVANYQMARRAVDQFALISEEELGGQPHLEGVRRRFLEAALGYYQDFLDQSNGRPDPELEASRVRVAAIVDELTTLLGIDRYVHIRTQPVQDELKLTREQRDRLKILNDRWRQSLAGGYGRKPADIERDRLRLAREQEAEINSLLTPQQQRRFNQLVLRFRGPFAMVDTEVMGELQLTADQRKRMRAIVDESTRFDPANYGLFGPGPSFRRGPPDRPDGEGRFPGFSPKGPPKDDHFKGGKKDWGKGPPDDRGPKDREAKDRENERSDDEAIRAFRERRKELMERLTAIMTPQQREKWQAMIGEPFEIPPQRDRPDRRRFE